nr:cerebellar degeneration-related protein 2 isoform X2 [Leptinotarsa decemlineata]
MMSDEPDSLQTLNSLDCWDYRFELECLEGNSDLHLAAELGKTLLERNKDLETTLKDYKAIIEDRTQEIEYLTKQTNALREVNDSRLRIYEQLEVSIQDLEHTNHRLLLENAAEKKQIKNLNATIYSLEAKCEDLQSTIDDLTLQLKVLKKSHASEAAEKAAAESIRKCISPQDDKLEEGDDLDSCGRSETKTHTTSRKNNVPAPHTTAATDQPRSFDSGIQNREEFYESDSSMEQMTQLLAQLEKTRAQCSRDERRIAELEEQLSTMVQQNQEFENQVMLFANRGDDLNAKSMHEELTTVEEVRQGQICSRCLRNVDYSESEILDDDSSSVLEEMMEPIMHHSSFSMQVQAHPADDSIADQSDNPYQDLVEKFEALDDVRKAVKLNQSFSLQKEMQMSDAYSIFNTKDTDEESGNGDSLHPGSHKKSLKTCSTPTDFSEAETNSSGYVDETHCKSTQTEGRLGEFLLSLADGDDCNFSRYNEHNLINARFKDNPEYQQVFKEIFVVLKNAAKRKAEGGDLPLLDDHTSMKASPKKLSNPQKPDDDTQSVVSSAMSELSKIVPSAVVENENQPPKQSEIEKSQERVGRPKIHTLDFLSVEVRKRSSSRRKSRLSDEGDRSESPATLIGNITVNHSSRPNSARKRRGQSRNMTMETDHGNAASPTPSQGSVKFEFKRSSASKDLHKLKKLDTTYAKVLCETKKSDTKVAEAKIAQALFSQNKRDLWDTRPILG